MDAKEENKGPGQPPKPPVAKPVEAPKAQKIDEEAAAIAEMADGDPDNELSKYAEPKGTKHTDQYNTAFPSEKNTVRQ